ncbi:MAG: hypothetical protein GWP10_08260 [Nitrospiraceae bacterium]|nr:hypothetical protein [Nitrospiraceae bacterium]
MMPKTKLYYIIEADKPTGRRIRVAGGRITRMNGRRVDVVGITASKRVAFETKSNHTNRTIYGCNEGDPEATRVTDLSED